MRTFLAGSAVNRNDLLDAKAEALKNFVLEFLQSSQFDTEYGHKSVNDLLAKNGLEITDDSVLAFLQRTAGEYIGLLVFATGEDDYDFCLVSGSQNDLIRMSGDG